jgi:hypothetical protein
MQELYGVTSTYGMKPPWNVALVGQRCTLCWVHERLHEVSGGQKRSPALEEELKRGDETEDADLDGNPHIGANAARC